MSGDNDRDKMAHVVGRKSRRLLQRSGYWVGLERNQSVEIFFPQFSFFPYIS